MIDITALVIAVIAVGAAALAGWPWLKQVIASKQWEQFMAVVAVAVKAAEQLGITGAVKDKLTWAKGRVKALLGQRGIVYDEQVVETAIEATVRELFPH